MPRKEKGGARIVCIAGNPLISGVFCWEDGTRGGGTRGWLCRGPLAPAPPRRPRCWAGGAIAGGGGLATHGRRAGAPVLAACQALLVMSWHAARTVFALSQDSRVLPRVGLPGRGLRARGERGRTADQSGLSAPGCPTGHGCNRTGVGWPAPRCIGQRLRHLEAAGSACQGSSDRRRNDS